jgi:hypothetical protein
MGALKTLGRGWLASPALPSAEMMETVGLLVILAVLDCSSLSSIQREKIQESEEFANVGGATSRLAQQPKSWHQNGHSFAHHSTLNLSRPDLHYLVLREAKETMQCEKKDALQEKPVC